MNYLNSYSVLANTFFIKQAEQCFQLLSYYVKSDGIFTSPKSITILPVFPSPMNSFDWYSGFRKLDNNLQYLGNRLLSRAAKRYVALTFGVFYRLFVTSLHNKEIFFLVIFNSIAVNGSVCKEADYSFIVWG